MELVLLDNRSNKSEVNLRLGLQIKLVQNTRRKGVIDVMTANAFGAKIRHHFGNARKSYVPFAENGRIIIRRAAPTQNETNRRTFASYIFQKIGGEG